MAKIKGITVTLIEPAVTIQDGFNSTQVLQEKRTAVENVLVAPVSIKDLPDDFDLNRYKEVYQIAIPKNDEHDWQDKTVEFYGKRWEVIGAPKMLMNHLVPLDWNCIWTVACYG